MAQFDAFSPFGVFGFSSKTSPCKTIFDGLDADMGGMLQGPVGEATRYGVAMGLGISAVQLDTAIAQSTPETCSVLLPELEREYQLRPSPMDTDGQRRKELALATRAGIMSSGSDLLRAGLTEILGDKLIRIIHETTPVEFPAVAPEPVNAFAPIRLYRTRDPVGARDDWCRYQAIHDNGKLLNRESDETKEEKDIESKKVSIKVGDTITIDPGKYGLEEQVVVEAVNPTEFYEVNRQQDLIPEQYGFDWHTFKALNSRTSFLATYTRPHEAGALISTASWPSRGSSQRNTVVIVDTSVLNNPTTIARIERFMRMALSGTSTWAITDGTGTSESATPTVFHVGVSKAIRNSVITG